MQMLDGKQPHELGTIAKERRNKILTGLRQECSIRQFERITGISRGLISRIKMQVM
jgi:hypothetical protein